MYDIAEGLSSARTREMSDSKVRGIIHFIDETKTYGQNGFRKRLVVLEQDKEKFTNYVPVEFTNDNCDTVDELNLGDDVEIDYRLNGRKWQKDARSEVKYFLNAEGMRFQVMGAKAAATAPAADANSALAEAAQDEDEPPF
jgi:hypothetical protein